MAKGLRMDALSLVLGLAVGAGALAVLDYLGYWDFGLLQVRR